MSWLFRRSKIFGLFRQSFFKPGIGYSFGVPDARAKVKQYVGGGIPGTGLLPVLIARRSAS